MRALVWIVDETWEACVDRARAILPDDASITLIYAEDATAEEIAAGAHSGLLGRGRAARTALHPEAERAAEALLAEAQERLGRPAQPRILVRGGARAIVTATNDADLLVLARDGDRRRIGPATLGRNARFVVDHAACDVLLVWPGEPDSVELPSPPDRARRRRG